MTDDPPQFIILYFDANVLHLYRNQSRRKQTQVDMVNALFQHGERADIGCITSPLTRLEMVNFAKRAAYVEQELETGRVDLRMVVDEALQRPRLEPERLTRTRQRIDGWFENQIEEGRLRVTDADDPTAVSRLAEVLIGETSISGVADCTHVATAILLGSSIIVTEDEHLRWCVTQELLQNGPARDVVQAALNALTGSDELSINALDIARTHAFVQRSLAQSRQDREGE